ncbi:uncharacterized protein RCC_04549 [Ramularia collo-cygni]|uniref:SWIM-type domain-containing protein n=1 Tax=Ramularia collo-cygni TaxID=112498 RepID=A0A2D3UWP6_9PEZI|nr:uncharacterized protein RCC_04549 [Ramularia collo-cygni]CZT18705.1 uncharacterized protein RCC_04549 [Ramularia collo-cygni]
MESTHIRESISNLSNPRHLIASLITSISTSTNSANTQNPLKSLQLSDKNLFLTLYALLEKELLPALDCLDRGLVTRLKVSDRNTSTLYLVRSAQQHHTRHGTVEKVNYYEVRLVAWSCSCPAFTFSAFPAQASTETENSACPKEPMLFGGLTKGSDLAVCKHLLACILVEHCKGFGHFAEEKEISREELAGWAAGWGD